MKLRLEIILITNTDECQYVRSSNDINYNMCSNKVDYILYSLIVQVEHLTDLK
jgi:hypothetical protein